MKWWLIVNLSHLIDGPGWDATIPASKRPSRLYLDRDDAEKELLRLRRLIGDEFAIFEAVAHAPAIGESGVHFEVQPIST